MEKLKLIIAREYLTRVRKRSFIIGTLMAPVGLLIYFLVIFGLSKYQSSGDLRLAVVDEAHILKSLPDSKGMRYALITDKSFESVRDEALKGTYDGVLRIPANLNLEQKDFTFQYFSEKKLALEKSEAIQRRLSTKIREYKIEKFGLNKAELDKLDTDIDIDPESLTGKGQNDSKYTAGVGLAIGGIMAFIMFFMVMMYGQMVMRSVMEEKTNRIVEVMMSSVKPFDLMMGKIIGAGLVGLTQVVAWVVLSGGVTLLLPLLVGEPAPMENPMMAQPGAQVDPEVAQDMALNIMSELGKQNWPLMIGAFIVFFLGGYFIYASLFAAIGSAMSDDMGEGQALTLPITIPIALASYIIVFVGIRNPDSGLMVFASLFPLFSPIVMPFRMAFNPPWWQVALSLVLVIAAALFFVWLSGRIYRVGILLYGKKVTFKELSKWLWYKG
jgi:ABC-2 type transport system permease protein